MDKTIGTPNEENGKAAFYFIISLIFSPVTIGGNMYLKEKIDEFLGVTFEERYNA